MTDRIAAADETSSAPPVRPVSIGWRFHSWLSIWLLALYLAFVLPTERLFPFVTHWYVGFPLVLILAAAVHVALRSTLWRAGNAAELTANVALMISTSLICAVGFDIGFTVYNNVNAGFRIDQRKFFLDRRADRNVWDGEVEPIPYTPTEENFWLYKPGQARKAATYGEHYYPALLRHPIMRDSVLELREVDFSIDRYGLRNTGAPDQARIFTLGDSFCFGVHARQNETFTAVMERRLREPVYNLGVSGSSPLPQYLLLNYLLRTNPDSFKPRRVLWLIFEGNDLEEDYSEKRNGRRQSLSTLFDGTLVSALARAPAVIRRQSIIHLVTNPDTILTGALARRTAVNHYALDGEALAYPLYRSARHGYRLFRQSYLDRATQPESYVLTHPNRPLLDDTFRRMKALAQEKGFGVTVVLVPSDARFYKDQFEDMPRITQEPHFIRYVQGLAKQVGFAAVDLHSELAPYSASEMIYYKDDTHWNPRGHELVAEVLSRHVTAFGD